jgi:hypothetical protein
MEDKDAQQPYQDRFEKFHDHFLSARLRPLDIDQVPEDVQNFFETRHKNLIEPPYPDFKTVYVIEHKSGGKTYVAQREVTYATNDETETLTFLYNINNSGQNTGYGEIRLNTSNQRNYYKDKPFVGYSYTEPDFTRKGLGTRRLRMMNALSQALHGLPLHSDTLLDENGAAKRVWERLVENGEAKHYKQGTRDRYCFV